MTYGVITRGGYSGGEWSETSRTINIQAKTRKKLQAKKDEATKTHTSAGSPIDFGYVSGTSEIEWSSQLWKLVSST